MTMEAAMSQTIPMIWVPIACGISLLSVGIVAAIKFPVDHDQECCMKIIAIILITSGLSCLIGLTMGWLAGRGF